MALNPEAQFLPWSLFSHWKQLLKTASDKYTHDAVLAMIWTELRLPCPSRPWREAHLPRRPQVCWPNAPSCPRPWPERHTTSPVLLQEPLRWGGSSVSDSTLLCEKHFPDLQHLGAVSLQLVYLRVMKYISEVEINTGNRNAHPEMSDRWWAKVHCPERTWRKLGNIQPAFGAEKGRKWSDWDWNVNRTYRTGRPH